MAGNRKFRYEILFEDRDILAINKPPGLLTVPIPNMRSANLQEMLQHRYNTNVRPAHRIDRYTSGIVVFAKNKNTHTELKRQFQAHEPDRLYLALVRGVVKEDEGTLEHYMKRVKHGFRNILVDKKDKQGTRAALHYRVVERFKASTLVLVALETGLKNQIRVQFQAIGHPLIGDQHYEKREKHKSDLDRQALHAAELTVVHPSTGKPVTFQCDPPEDMQALIASQR